jgi:hypothetical protein
VDVLVEDTAEEPCGRAEHQAPEVDGECVLAGPGAHSLAVGDLVRSRVIAAKGIDLIVEPMELTAPAGGGR